MALWVGVALLLGLGTVVEPETMIWIMLPIAGLAILNKEQLTAKKWETPSPLEILERYPFWKYIAVTYTAALVIAVIYHLFVARIPVFDDPPFFLVILGLIGPMLGPLVVGQIEAYRNLGDENDA